MLILAKHTATNIHGKRMTEDRNGIHSNIFLAMYIRFFSSFGWDHFDMLAYNIIIGMQPLILRSKMHDRWLRLQD